MDAGLLTMGGPRAFQSDDTRREEVCRDLIAAAYQQGTFLLSSGEESQHYFDKYLFETRPTILRRLASLMAEMVPPDVDRLVGCELGGVPLTVALSLETGIPYVVIRDLASARRVPARVVGEIHADEKVLIIEDVVATGARAVETVDYIRKFEVDVAGVLTVVDRQQGGGDRIIQAGSSLRALLELDLDRLESMSGSLPSED
jgi:orotate phosphoribosyltransferase